MSTVRSIDAARTEPAHLAPEAGRPGRRHETLLTVTPGVLLAAALTAWHYSSKPMWRDEWFTYSTVERPFTGMVHLLAEKDGGLAGFYLVMHVWMLMGDSVAWMRLPAALCTVLLSALAALLGRHVGGPAVGAVSGVLVAMMPTVIDHAQEARAYPLVLAAVTATGLAALRYREHPSVGRWAMLATLGLTAAALHPLPGVPAVAGIFLGLLVQPGPSSRWRILLAGVPAALVAAVLIGLGAAQNDVTAVGNVGGARQLISVRYLVAPGWGLLVVMLALSAASLVALWHRQGPLVVLLAWIVLPVVELMTLIVLGSFFQPRYVSAVVPAAVVLVAVGMVTVASSAARIAPLRFRTPARTVAISVATIAVVVSLAPSAARTVISPFRTDDPRAATNALVAGYRDGDAVVYSGSMARGLTHHYASPGDRLEDPLLIRSPMASNTVQGEEVSAKQTASAVNSFERLWVVGTMSEPGDRWSSEEKIDAATAGRSLVENRTFGRYRLQMWVTNSG